jgi:beta-lactamase class A
VRRASWLPVALVLAASDALAAAPRELSAARATALERSLRELAAEGGASYGIYFKDLRSGRSIRIGAEKTMHAASTMKVPVMLEALRRVDRGSLKLRQQIPVRNEFKSVIDGSPFSLTLDPKGVDGPTMARLGRSASLEFLMTEMIAHSSNLAANVLLSRLEPAHVQQFTDALGARGMKVRRCLEDGKAFERGLSNETDAAALGVLMEAAVRSPRLSRRSRAKAWQILRAQRFNEQIPTGIPRAAGAVVGHKTGTISSVQHDAAVVRLKDGREYVLVLLANDFGANEAGRQRVYEVTRRMSLAVYEAMTAR